MENLHYIPEDEYNDNIKKRSDNSSEKAIHDKKCDDQTSKFEKLIQHCNLYPQFVTGSYQDIKQAIEEINVSEITSPNPHNDMMPYDKEIGIDYIFNNFSIEQLSKKYHLATNTIDRRIKRFTQKFRRNAIFHDTIQKFYDKNSRKQLSKITRKAKRVSKFRI